MSGFNIREKASKGWHPKGKDGKSKESWRGDFKGIDQISGWMGKSKSQTDATDSNEPEHVAQPITSLKDPRSFGPPPKKTNYPGAPSPTTTPTSSGTQAGYFGTESRREAEEPEEPKPPPQPYRRDTTGLNTTHLPPPPNRRDGADGRAPVPKTKPSLPPRLPPRQTETPSSYTPPPPPTYHEATLEPPVHKGILNQDSLNRLGSAGVSVPGFGIGGKVPEAGPRQPLPPPSRTPSSSSTQPPSTNSQLNELQSRFSRFGTSSPKEESTSQGTTWAEKQAALKTASSFKKDPSTVSFSDARNAASTANNFRERHGAQVASGLKSANSLNTKYGLTDKAASYGASSRQAEIEHDHSSGIVMQDNTVSPVKKAPPPPPKKKPGLVAAVANSEGPPPIPLASKPKPSFNKPRPNFEDFDLDLQTLWFANQSIVFPPPSIERVPGSRSYRYSSGWSSNGTRKTHTFTGLVIYSTLARTKIHLTWDGSNPSLTVKPEQKHFSPPRHLSRSELENYRSQYSEQLAFWCEEQMGTQVGNGECWTLANDGLAAIATGCSSRNQVPCMTSQSYVHGALIYEKISPRSSEPSGGIVAAGVARGDIIQFWKARFEAKDGRSWKSAGAPDHTAVITSVEKSGVVGVVEQNTGGVKRVKRGSYDVEELVEGEVRVFRAVCATWVGSLEPIWP